MGMLSGIWMLAVVFMTLDRLYEHEPTYIGELTLTLNQIQVNNDKLQYPTEEYGIIQVENAPKQDTTIHAYSIKGITFNQTIFWLNKNKKTRKDLGYVWFSESD